MYKRQGGTRSWPAICAAGEHEGKVPLSTGVGDRVVVKVQPRDDAADVVAVEVKAEATAPNDADETTVAELSPQDSEAVTAAEAAAKKAADAAAAAAAAETAVEAGRQLLSGKEWYTQEAFRALNQVRVRLETTGLGGVHCRGTNAEKCLLRARRLLIGLPLSRRFVIGRKSLDAM